MILLLVLTTLAVLLMLSVVEKKRIWLNLQTAKIPCFGQSYSIQTTGTIGISLDCEISGYHKRTFRAMGEKKKFMIWVIGEKMLLWYEFKDQ